MPTVSKICALALMGQTAVARPQNVITDLNNNTVPAVPAAKDTSTDPSIFSTVLKKIASIHESANASSSALNDTVPNRAFLDKVLEKLDEDDDEDEAIASVHVPEAVPATSVSVAEAEPTETPPSIAQTLFTKIFGNETVSKRDFLDKVLEKLDDDDDEDEATASVHVHEAPATSVPVAEAEPTETSPTIPEALFTKIFGKERDLPSSSSSANDEAASKTLADDEPTETVASEVEAAATESNVVNLLKNKAVSMINAKNETTSSLASSSAAPTATVAAKDISDDDFSFSDLLRKVVDDNDKDKREIHSEAKTVSNPSEVIIEEAVVFTTGYTTSSATSFVTETSVPASEYTSVQQALIAPPSTNVFRNDEIWPIPTPYSNEQLELDEIVEHEDEEDTDSASVEEELEFGASAAKEEKKTDSSTTKTEEKTKTSSTKQSAEGEKQQDKEDFGAVEKRGQHDQQWADYYNKAGAYEGLEYDPHQYLLEHEQSLPEHQRLSNQPVQKPQPTPEEKPIFLPASEKPAPQPQHPSPKPHEEAPIIIPAPQRPPPLQAPKPHQPAPGPQAPVKGPQGQPGEEEYEDFVMFVPKDQSDGAKPYMLPAAEYNPKTPPKRLPPGVKPPPPPINRAPKPEPVEQGSVPEPIEQFTAPIDGAVPIEEAQQQPVGPPGGQLSEAPHALPEWFPTRPGSLGKRDELEERNDHEHPYGRQFENTPATFDEDDSARPTYQELNDKFSSLVQPKEARGLFGSSTSSKPSSAPIPKVPTAPKSTAPKFDYDSKAGKIKNFVAPAPKSAKPHKPLKHVKPAKPVKFDSDDDEDEFDDDDEFEEDNESGYDLSQGIIKPHQRRALADFLGNGEFQGRRPYGPSLRDYIPRARFGGRCPGFDNSEPGYYPECRQPHCPCPGYEYEHYPYPEPEHPLCEPSYGPCPVYEHPEPEYHRGDYYPRVELGPESYPEYEHHQPEYYEPEHYEPKYYEPKYDELECHTCGPQDGSYTGYPEHPYTYPEYPPPQAQYKPQVEPQKPCPKCVQPHLEYHSEPEQECHACEQSQGALPEYPPQTYEPAPEVPYQQPEVPYQQPEVPYQQPVEPASQPQEPCHDCEQGPEPAPQAQPEDSCHACQQPSEPVPVPEPEPEEPCHASQSEPACNGPNFDQVQQPHHPQDGSYSVEEPAGLQPPPETVGPPPEDAHFYPDGSYSHYPVDHPEHYPEYEPPKPAPKPSYPWHFPTSTFENDQPPFDPEQHHEAPAPEPQPEQPASQPHEPAPEPGCHECPQTPEYAPQPYEPAPEAPYQQEYEPAPAPEQQGCPCEQNGQPQGASDNSCAC